MRWFHISCILYVAIGTTFILNNSRAVAIDSRFSFFISTVAFVALIALSLMCLDSAALHFNFTFYHLFDQFLDHG